MKSAVCASPGEHQGGRDPAGANGGGGEVVLAGLGVWGFPELPETPKVGGR